jgi:CIC family chloride channel protein
MAVATPIGGPPRVSDRPPVGPGHTPGRSIAARRVWRRSALRLRRFVRNDQFHLVILSVLIGAAAAVAAIGFRLLISGIQHVFFNERSEKLYSAVLTLPWWQILLGPAVGGLLIGLFIRYLLPERRPLGVADVMEAAATRDGEMSLKGGLLASFANAASIGCGASVGREGPVVLLGAALASAVGKWLRLSRSFVMTLVGCGVASAVAASFNAPLAGALFALEVVIGHYRLQAFAPVVIASVTGTVISRGYYGAFPAFIKPHFEIESIWEFPAFGLLGVVSAIMAIVMMASIMFASRSAERMPAPPWLHPAFAGLAVGAIALVYPQALGVGYEPTDIVLKGGFGFWLLAGVIVAKTVATAISLGGGFGGGVFSPSLVLGGMLGAAYGMVAATLFPDLASDRGAYALVGMGAVAGAVLGAPISTILIVFELTGDYEVTVAVMVAVVIASLITQAVVGRSFFQWQLARRGVTVGLDPTQAILRRTRMRLLIDPHFSAAGEDTDVALLRRMLLAAPRRPIYVVDGAGGYRGVVALGDLFARREAGDGEEGAEPPLEAVMRRPPFLLADDHVEEAMTVFARTTETTLPVVEDRDSLRLIGTVQQRDVMLAYDRAHRQAREG